MPPRVADWFIPGVNVLKSVYRVLNTGVRQSLADYYYRVGNVIRNHSGFFPHPHRVNVGPTTVDHSADALPGRFVAAPSDPPMVTLYNFRDHMDGEILVHHWSVSKGDQECSFEEIRPRMIYLLTNKLMYDLASSNHGYKVQVKMSLAGKFLTSNLFEVSPDTAEPEVRKKVEDAVDEDLASQIDDALQSSQDQVRGVTEFGMTNTIREESQDRTSQSRSRSRSRSSDPSISSDDPFIPDHPTPLPPTRRKNQRRGGSYLPTPAGLKGRRGLCNIKNHHDHECFKYAICAALHPEALTRYTRSTAKNWRVYFDELKWGDLHFPLHVNDISKFEDLNPTLAVNVMSWNPEKMIHVRERATKHPDRQTLWLMLINSETISHYITILNPEGFLSHGRRCKKHTCPMCWQQFSSAKPLETHLHDGCLVHGDAPADVVPLEDKGIKFSDWDNKKKTLQHTKYYADFETETVKTVKTVKTVSMLPETSGTLPKTVLLGRQDPMSYNIQRKRETGKAGPRWKPPIHFIRPSSMSRHEFMRHFWDDLLTAVLEDYNEIRTVEPLVISKDERAWVKAKRKCCLCKERFKNKEIQRHAHHDHETGKLIGAAHAKCNLDHNFEKVVIPVFLHNFTGYDSHLILEGSAPALNCPLDEFSEYQSCFDGDLTVLPVNSQRMKTIVVKPTLPPAQPGMKPPNIVIEFKDSMAFLNGSLEKLVESLANTDKTQFRALKEHVQSLLPSDKVARGFELLLRKGVYPHSYIDSVERLHETSLPPIEAFHNDLKDKPCSLEDYEHAQTVWKFFGHKTLRDYHDLYLNCDTAQLGDVFENFIKMCHEVFEIEPCTKVGAPGLFWDAMLKKTGQRLSQLIDLEMVHMYERGVRGGITFVSSQYAKANNKHTPGFDPSQESTYIPYWDANSLYPWAMTQALPYGRHKWIYDPAKLKKVLATPTKDSDRTGYTFEVDMHAPQEIHDAEADYPCLSEKRTIPLDQLSPHISSMLREKRTERPRLINHLLPVTNYVVDLRWLQYMIGRGYVVDKIHRAVSFSQSKWMKPYIDLCVSNRQEAKKNGDSVKADFFKISMNAVFGRSMENVRNRCNFKFAHTKEEIRKLSNKHNFNGCCIIRPDDYVNSSLVGVTMKKEKVLLNKPLYIGTTILDLAKLKMHHFLDKLSAIVRVKLLYTDTDSLIIQVHCDDLYKLQDHPDLIDDFDFNHSLRNSNHHLPSVPGPMKLEPGTDCHLSEFIGLFPKGYATRVIGADSLPHKKEPFKCTSKGFSLPSNEATFNTYKDCLFNDTHTDETSICLRSRNHVMHKEQHTRLGAYSSMGDKRYPTKPNYEEGIFDSLPFGHYKIPHIVNECP